MLVSPSMIKKSYFAGKVAFQKINRKNGKNIFPSDGKIGVTKKFPNLRNLRQNKKKYSVALLGSFSYTSWENYETIRAIFPCYLDHKK